MRIVIREGRPSGHHFRIVLPYHVFINMLVRKTWFRLGLKHGLSHARLDASGQPIDESPERTARRQRELEKALAYLEAVDFGELRQALHSISTVKGLVLVEVESSDGSYVNITT